MARFGYIQVIRRCNQRCVFCSNPDNDAVLPADEVRRLVEDFARRGFEGVLLTGGEPTLHPGLPELIRIARAAGIAPRVITNGQRTADRVYLEELLAAGLEHVHVSLQSHRAEVQAALSGKEDSLACLEATLGHLGELEITADVNTTIGSYNADHLDETVSWLLERFPRLRHWVWNNLDPTSERCTAHPEVIAPPRRFELSLFRAMVLLERSGRSFRVERVPLCYLGPAFAHCATETRKLVKRESREIAFLDARGHVDDAELWRRYGKAAACRVCTLDPICAGLFACDLHDFRDELYPMFVSREAIERRVREGG